MVQEAQAQAKVNIGDPDIIIGAMKYWSLAALSLATGKTKAAIMHRAEAQGFDGAIGNGIRQRGYTKTKAEAIANSPRAVGRPVGTTGAYGPHKATLARMVQPIDPEEGLTLPEDPEDSFQTDTIPSLPDTAS